MSTFIEQIVQVDVLNVCNCISAMPLSRNKVKLFIFIVFYLEKFRQKNVQLFSKSFNLQHRMDVDRRF